MQRFHRRAAAVIPKAVPKAVRRAIRGILILLLALLGATGAATVARAQPIAAPAGPKEPPKGEGLQVEPPPGWLVYDQVRSAEAEEVFLVPPDQKTTDWRDMIVYREMKGVTNVAPRAMLEQSVEAARAGCPNLIARQIQEGAVNGYPGAFLLVSCPGGGGGPAKGEINLVKVIAGTENMYMIQRTWRLSAFDPNRPPVNSRTLDIWVKYLSVQRPCDTRDARHPCQGAAPEPAPSPLEQGRPAAGPGR